MPTKTTYEVTKTEVRSSFQYARELMRQADKLLSDKSVTSFDNNSEFGQLCNELVANVAILDTYLQERA
ncbi:hypothetical protein UFOVP964_105 [uncultured Caudovirales phage]|uniref:Uncharacterized protein n=1 Tax=uncultured Caudovirales phage TaxID=2100421 RepID=A0A6J5Q0P7_9CAUD|nr:hypothetical protein UFOVP854_105 [uncultured Caudovirales phage]CAB4174975.1 hypothetical protein UFOVP964_105 [uncultured Caudovirales phage]CAB4179269.1 hypothetical protein UFOVP1034_53 [uncultured Caudovirales phage]CAB4189097.1 hypothetical protein UFOVP1177_53 [uncultured Caudovirales phage]CAB4193214.1 hypothetical protein UFOVP1243_40 [uncultured Caudovirales phage]